jgi:hypothetical protein
LLQRSQTRQFPRSRNLWVFKQFEQYLLRILNMADSRRRSRAPVAPKKTEAIGLKHKQCHAFTGSEHPIPRPRPTSRVNTAVLTVTAGVSKAPRRSRAWAAGLETSGPCAPISVSWAGILTMTSQGFSGAPCWFCGTQASASRAEVESVVESRSEADGGPFLTLTCLACRTRCGALRNRRGTWLLYPLEGATEPTLVDRIVPRTSREHQLRARTWWLRNAGNVERFRATSPEPEPPRRAPPPPRPRATTNGRVGRPAPPPPPARTGPRADLGVADDATLADVRRAWRAAVKRWHPDRIPTSDPVVVGEAMRRFQEMRAAYEALVAELSR